MATAIPSNQARFSRAELCAALGLASGDLPDGVACVGVETDSRQELSGKLFVALRGERFDGHDYVQRAAAAGAVAALVEHPVAGAELPQIQVSDTLRALGDLAAFHRRRWGGVVVAVAGSAGKTTTRSAITALLRQKWGEELAVTPGNLNNLIGVPMVLFTVDERHRAAVLELGTNQRGEVRELRRIAQPDHAVLTLIDWEHSEGLGDLDGIEEEEAAIWEDTTSPLVHAIGNGDDARVRRRWVTAVAKERTLYGTSPDCSYRVVGREPLSATSALVRLTRPRGGELSFQSGLLGYPGALAVAAAVAATELVTGELVTSSELVAALGAEFRGEAGRLRSEERSDGLLILDDAYNANPGSMRSSLQVARELAAQRGGRWVAILGEMRELGVFSESEHRNLGEVLAAAPPGELLLVGEAMGPCAEAFRSSGRECCWVRDAAAAVAVLPPLGGRDLVLLKGSRGVRLEQLIPALLERNETSV